MSEPDDDEERVEIGPPEVGPSTGKSRRVVCRSCGQETNHVVKAWAKWRWECGVEAYEVVECLGCGRLSFRLEEFSDAHAHYGRPPTVTTYPRVFTERPELWDSNHFPPLMRKLYDEVRAAFRERLDVLATIGLRALLERTCIELGAKGFGLEEKLNQVVTLGKLLPEDVRTLHPIRNFGNDAAHEVEAPEWADLVGALGVVEHLLERVFLVPKRAERLADSSEASRRARGERKHKEKSEE